jgi:mitochondrial enoyl-[acyl-carrier protein] reductase / trans-2-enoyl-CoA reductase
MQNLAAVYKETGKPTEVLHLQSLNIPELTSNQVLIRMLLAPVNPSDLNMMEGTYGIKAILPAVGGNEGVGRVERVGADVTKLKSGMLVRPAKGEGTWQRWIVCQADECLIFPESLTPEQAAMLYVNPATAWRLLHDIYRLEPGEWIIQNASNSAVGRAVIQIARNLGLRTINLVRRAELMDELRNLGADCVLLDHPDSIAEINNQVATQAPRLALNAVGGESASLLTKVMADGATLVTYGAMSKQSLRIGNSLLIFKNLRFQGYWMSRWYQSTPLTEINQMFDSLAKLHQQGKLQIPVAATYPLEEILHAVAAAQESSRNGKIMIRLNT